MNCNPEKFIQSNSPDGGFLQSSEWRKFQETVGRKTFTVSFDIFHANIIEHSLPIVGKYFYVPRGPVLEISNDQTKNGIVDLIKLTEKSKIGWIRIEPATEEILGNIKAWTSDVPNAFGHPMSFKIVKAPHDMQPQEIFVIDIAKPEEDLLAEMKSKTRYNIKLAEKKGVIVRESANDQNAEKYITEFLRLIKITAARDGIVSHPENYYRQMLRTIPSEMLKLYVAEYQGKIIAANLVLFFGNTCTYMHGASDDEHRNVMAPYLLQWRQMQDAKRVGCNRYDFGGIRNQKNSWAGITRFKTGFSPSTSATEFPGSYDVIINAKKYYLYRLLQKIKSFAK